jgi:hypothetical protein
MLPFLESIVCLKPEKQLSNQDQLLAIDIIIKQ